MNHSQPNCLSCFKLAFHGRLGAVSRLIRRQFHCPPAFKSPFFAEPSQCPVHDFRRRWNTVRGNAQGRQGLYALVDRDKDFKAGLTIDLAQGVNVPIGVAFKNGHLYVAEVHRVIRFENIVDNLAPVAPCTVVNDSLPADRRHGWKFIRFGPDEKLYVPMGVPCNVCGEEDRRFATIMRTNADGSGLEVFAEGVRNSVGFDWHPQILEDGSLLVADDDAGRIYRFTYHT